jgi:hypothetical protein
MTVHVPRLPLSLDPLMAEAKRRMRERRLLVAVLIVVVAGGAAGATLGLRGPSGPNSTPGGAGHGLATSHFGGMSVSYPAAWKPVKWDCWIGPIDMLLLTTVRPTPTCGGSTMPPSTQIGRDGVDVWFAFLPAFKGETAWALRRNPTPVGIWAGTERATCAKGAGTRRRFGARLVHGSVAVLVAAGICGPHYAKNVAALRAMLSNASFKG